MRSASAGGLFLAVASGTRRWMQNFWPVLFSSLDMQSVSLERQVKTPSKIFMKPYHMVLLVEGKPSTA